MTAYVALAILTATSLTKELPMQTTQLNTTRLGSTDLEITRLGFSAWAIGGGGWEFGWGPQDDEESIGAIHRAIALGVNWIDTAAAYGFGRSERVVGRALEGLTERPYVFTKCSLIEGPGRRVVNSLKRDSILREAENSLQRLGIDAIDLYRSTGPSRARTSKRAGERSPTTGARPTPASRIRGSPGTSPPWNGWRASPSGRGRPPARSRSPGRCATGCRRRDRRLPAAGPGRRHRRRGQPRAERGRHRDDRLEGMNMTTTTRIGFIGLGHMGGGMAARLLAAGYPVCGTDRDREHTRELLDAGLRWLDTAGEVARAADAVFTSLPDDDVVEAVATGPDGVLAALDSGTTWVDVSTISPRLTRDLAERARAHGAARLDAPVSGSVPQVRAGTLTIMVGGDDAAYARVEPILRELGTPTHVGDSGHGQVLKLAVNISLAVQMLALAEGLLLAERAGLDTKLALDVMTSSAIGSPMLKARAPLILDLPDDAWFDIGLMSKDIQLARGAAHEVGAPLPTAERAAEILDAARTLGYEHRDLAGLFAVLEQMAAQPTVGR
jgi:3-hydroxyisobutyrate dehydrogenase-like beta-hydroxyacid dehydrogenase